MALNAVPGNADFPVYMRHRRKMALPTGSGVRPKRRGVWLRYLPHTSLTFIGGGGLALGGSASMVRSMVFIGGGGIKLNGNATTSSGLLSTPLQADENVVQVPSVNMDEEVVNLPLELETD